jgi:acetylglutamate kinase
MHSESITVMKVGGNELDSPDFAASLCSSLAAWQQPCILVHGGGKEISAALEHAGQPVQFIQGVRVTPPESMAIMEMVVCGSINKRIVALLVAAGQPALGLSGVDLGLLRCEPYTIDGTSLGRVGIVTRVETSLLHRMLQQGWLPVIAPVALGASDNLPYNVNADMVAQAVAIALATGNAGKVATELVFVSNVPGVVWNGVVATHLTAAAIERGIQGNIISGGMIPKVRAALAALEQGVATVRITNLEGLVNGGTTIELVER